MVPKFKCNACGSCCSAIQGLSGDSEKSFISEFGYGKLPLVQLTPFDKITFPLWDFEAKRFREYEKREGIDAKIIPSKAVFDLDSNRLIVFTYQMNSKSCPFLLESGKCRIYDTKRGFICHLFPINVTPFIDTKNTGVVFGECPQVKEVEKGLEYKDKAKLIKDLYHSFGNGFLSAVQHDLIMEWSNRVLIDLIKSKKIRPAVNYPYDLLLRRIENSDRIDLLDFLVEIGYFTTEQAQKKIISFETLVDARKILRPYTV